MRFSVEGMTMSDQDQRTKGYYISRLIFLWSFGVGPGSFGFGPGAL